MDSHIMRCGTIGSCQSAAISEIVKALLVASLTRVSGAITSVQTFTFTLVTSTTKSCCCSVNIYLVCSIIPPLSPPHRRPYYNHSVFLSVCVSVPAAINSGTKRNAQLNSMRMWPVSQVTNLTDLSWKGQKHNGTMPRKRDTENTRQFLNERPLAETHTVHKRSTF